MRDDRGRRRGFKIISLDGQEDMLASVDIVSNNKVSKYGVSIAAMERVGVPAIRDALDHKDIVVIDEIGRMELLSKQFRNVITQVLDSPKPVLGTVAIKSVNFAKKAGERQDTKIIKLTRANGPEIITHVGRLLEKLNLDGKQSV